MKICPKCGKQFADDANFCPVDAARLTAVEAAVVQDEFDQRFELQARLGGATTGPVFRALDRTTSKQLAVKMVSADVTAQPSVGAKIERELRQLERVDAPGIARVVASGKKGEQTWVATEYLDGAQTLAQAIGARGPIDAGSAARLVDMIGEALIEAAKAGVVHRDLAPKNVLFAGEQVKLINFCVPVVVGGTDRVPGVPEFVAPETVEGKGVDQRSNIYSLGAIHYYVLTGQAPIEGDPTSVLRSKVEGTIPPPSGRGAAVPPDVDALVKRALDRSPSKRYLTVRQYLDEVARVAGGGAADPSATAAGGRAGRPHAAELIRTLTGLPASYGQPSAPALVSAVGSGPASGPVIELTQPKSPAETMPLGGSGPTAAHAEPAPAAPPAAPAPAAAAPAVEAPVLPPAPAFAPVAAVVPAPGSATEQLPAVAAAAPAVASTPAAPAVSSPLMPAGPILTSPAALAAASAAAGKKKADDDKGSKGKFRETLWFKKGEMDAAAAEAAAAAAAAGKEAGADKADTKPIEDRYQDDGTVSHADRDKYSLKTGGTQMMAAIRAPAPSESSPSVSERELVGEMKGGRTGVMVAIVVGLLLVGGLVAWLAMR